MRVERPTIGEDLPGPGKPKTWDTPEEPHIERIAGPRERPVVPDLPVMNREPAAAQELPPVINREPVEARELQTPENGRAPEAPEIAPRPRMEPDRPPLVETPPHEIPEVPGITQEPHERPVAPEGSAATEHEGPRDLPYPQFPAFQMTAPRPMFDPQQLRTLWRDTIERRAVEMQQ